MLSDAQFLVLHLIEERFVVGLSGLLFPQLSEKRRITVINKERSYSHAVRVEYTDCFFGIGQVAFHSCIVHCFPHFSRKHGQVFDLEEFDIIKRHPAREIG